MNCGSCVPFLGDKSVPRNEELDAALTVLSSVWDTISNYLVHHCEDSKISETKLLQDKYARLLWNQLHGFLDDKEEDIYDKI